MFFCPAEIAEIAEILISLYNVKLTICKAGEVISAISAISAGQLKKCVV